MKHQRLEILHEDNDVIVVDKPAGLPSIAPEGSRMRSAYGIVTELIRRRNPKGRAAVVHRLDRDTSGVMVFATNAKAKAELMSNWNELVLCRRYLAVVEGLVREDAFVMDDWLIERTIGRVSVAKPGESCANGPALRAVSSVRVLKRGASYSLVELELETGRKHQIRAQLASRGHPVAGDERYGSRSDPAGRLCLHANLLVFMRRIGEEPMRFESPMPPEFAAALSRKAEPHAAAKRNAPSRAAASSDTAPRGAGQRGARQGGKKREQDRKDRPGRDSEERQPRRAVPPRKPAGGKPGTATSGPRKSSSRYPMDTRRRP